MFGAMVKKGDPIEPVKKKLIEEIENAFARSGVTEEELNRQKADQEMMFERTLSDPEEFGVELSDYIALGDWRLFFVDREQVKNVTPAQIDAAAAKYFVATTVSSGSLCRMIIQSALKLPRRLRLKN